MGWGLSGVDRMSRCPWGHKFCPDRQSIVGHDGGMICPVGRAGGLQSQKSSTGP
jgi:hypothetical protein